MPVYPGAFSDPRDPQIDTNILDPIRAQIDQRIAALGPLEFVKKQNYEEARSLVADWGNQAVDSLDSAMFDNVGKSINFNVPGPIGATERPIPEALQKVLDSAASIVSDSLNLTPEWNPESLQSPAFSDALDAAEGGNFQSLTDFIVEPATYIKGISGTIDLLRGSSIIVPLTFGISDMHGQGGWSHNTYSASLGSVDVTIGAWNIRGYQRGFASAASRGQTRESGFKPSQKASLPLGVRRKPVGHESSRPNERLPTPDHAAINSLVGNKRVRNSDNYGADIGSGVFLGSPDSPTAQGETVQRVTSTGRGPATS